MRRPNILLGALAVLGLACSAGPKMRVPESMDVAPSQPLVLSVAAPSGETTPSTVTGAPQLLQIEIAQIDNPSRQAFTIAVSYVSSSAAAVVGTVAPYPPDQTGRLSLLVPPAVQLAIAANQAPPRFRLALQPAATDRPLQPPLQISVSRLALGPG
jgi:hypothetical protein